MRWYSKNSDLVLKQVGEAGLFNRGRRVGGMSFTVPLFEKFTKCHVLFEKYHNIVKRKR